MNTEIFSGQLKEHQESIKRLTESMALVTVVLLVAFVIVFITMGGFLQNYLANKQATYQNLVNQVTEQNVRIDTLTEEIRWLKAIQIQTLNWQIEP